MKNQINRRRLLARLSVAAASTGLGQIITACDDPKKQSSSSSTRKSIDSTVSQDSTSMMTSAVSSPSASAVKDPVQDPNLPVIDPNTLSATVIVRFETDKGAFTAHLYPRKAPKTVANFLMYVVTKKLDGAVFWRASRQEGGTGFIQATATGVKFPPIDHESTRETGLTHTDGVLSMARFGVGTATNEFTISVGDQTYLDAGRDSKGDNQGYAAFGRVVSGMKTVRAILMSRLDKARAEPGGWDGQMLKPPIKIIKAVWVNEPQTSQTAPS
jgi:peptidyl-prolyl cis-trans isomerase A (cyclophilin A)